MSQARNSSRSASRPLRASDLQMSWPSDEGKESSRVNLGQQSHFLVQTGSRRAQFGL